MDDRAEQPGDLDCSSLRLDRGRGVGLSQKPVAFFSCPHLPQLTGTQQPRVKGLTHLMKWALASWAAVFHLGVRVVLSGTFSGFMGYLVCSPGEGCSRGKGKGSPNQCSLSTPEEAEDPACIPIFWVSKWVDYSDKYGLGRCPRMWNGQGMVWLW